MKLQFEFLNISILLRIGVARFGFSMLERAGTPGGGRLPRLTSLKIIRLPAVGIEKGFAVNEVGPLFSFAFRLGIVKLNLDGVFECLEVKQVVVFLFDNSKGCFTD